MKVITRHIFKDHLASVGEIIKAKKSNDNAFQLKSKFQPGGRRTDMYGYPIQIRSQSKLDGSP